MPHPEMSSPAPRRPLAKDDPLAQYAPRSSSPSRSAPKASPEVENSWKRFPNNIGHRAGTATYEMARRTIRALANGPGNSLDPGQVAKLTEAMTDPREKYHKRYTREEVDRFLAHKFPPRERLEMYERLSNYHNPAYRRGAGGKASLATALYDGNLGGFSLIMKLWYDPPKLIAPLVVPVRPEALPVVDMVLEALGRSDGLTASAVSKNVAHMDFVFRKSIWPSMSPEARRHFGDFQVWARGLVDHAMERQGPDFRANPGWFKIGSKVCSEWEARVRRMADGGEEENEFGSLFAQWRAEL